VAVASRYGHEDMARTLGGVLCLIIATVRQGDDGGDWRDGVTIIASERPCGEVVDWFRLRLGAADPGANRVAQDTRLGNLPNDDLGRQLRAKAASEGSATRPC
jgi:hypothetical protein